MKLKAHWAAAVTVLATTGLVAGVYYLNEYLRDNKPATEGVCRNSYYAQGMDCLAKDENGNPLSIDINTPETPRP